MATKGKSLTAERVRELLDYDPVTGALDWINPAPRLPSEGGKAGHIALTGKRSARRFLNIDYKRYPAHRIVWLHAKGTWPLGSLVANNGDYDDLKLANFSDLTRAEAAQLGGPFTSNTSGHRGVSWEKKRKRWQAYITHNYKRVHIGYYKTVDEAVQARAQAEANRDTLPTLSDAERKAKYLVTSADAKMRALWRKVNRQTGRVVGWESYEGFCTEVQTPPSDPRVFMVPLDDTKRLGPNNYTWATRWSCWDQTTPEGKLAYGRAYRKKNTHVWRDHMFRTKFGITLVDYHNMLDAQTGVCAICKQPETRTRYGKPTILAVDHCHTAGHVRGLLCNNCNNGVGRFRDDPALLRAAADYLERHAVKSNGAASPSTPRHEERDAHHEDPPPR